MMDFLQSGRALISIPPEAFGTSNPASAAFEISETLIRLLDNDAAWAVRTVLEGCRETGTSVTGMMRPEICADPAVLNWVEERAGAFTEHICLSTGRTLKLIAGKRNYAFIYGTSLNTNHQAFHALCRRAPEMVGQVEAQINTAFRLGKTSVFAPPTVLMQPPERSFEIQQPLILEWWMTRDGTSETQPINKLNHFEYLPDRSVSHVNVITVNSSALNCNHFLKFLARKLHHALYYDELTLLQIPDEAIENIDGWAANLTRLLRQSGFKLPFLRTQAILLANERLLPWLLSQDGPRLDLTLHHTQPLWLYGFIDPSRMTNLCLLADRTELNDEIYEEFSTAILPVRPQIVWNRD